MEGERVGDWIRRWIKAKAIDWDEVDSVPLPTMFDFESHGCFPFVQLDMNPDENQSFELRKFYVAFRESITAGDEPAIDAKDFHMTPDLKVWFTNSDIAMVFKLHWNR